MLIPVNEFMKVVNRVLPDSSYKRDCVKEIDHMKREGRPLSIKEEKNEYLYRILVENIDVLMQDKKIYELEVDNIVDMYNELRNRPGKILYMSPIQIIFLNLEENINYIVKITSIFHVDQEKVAALSKLQGGKFLVKLMSDPVNPNVVQTFRNTCSEYEVSFLRDIRMITWYTDLVNDEIWRRIKTNNLRDFFPEILKQKKIDWKEISNNHSLTCDIMEKYANELDWKLISSNNNVNIKIIRKFSKRFNWKILSGNSVMTLEIVREFQNMISWPDLSANTYIGARIIDEFKDRLYPSCLSNNSSLTIDHLYYYGDRLDWDKVSRHITLTFEIIEKFIDKLNVTKLSQNPSLTSNMIRRFRNIDWNWKSIFTNFRLDKHFYDEYEDKIDFSSLSNNLCITSKLINKYKDKLDWSCLSFNPALTFNDIHNHFDRLNYRGLSCNLCLPEYMMIIIESVLNWNFICNNLPITPYIVEKYKHKINWKVLSSNPCLSANMVKLYKDKLKLECLCSPKDVSSVYSVMLSMD